MLLERENQSTDLTGLRPITKEVNMKSSTKVLIILSGGQDSTTCLFWAKEKYEEVHAITFDYGQRHKIEIEAARRVASMAGVASHEVVVIGDSILKSTSPLTSNNELEQYEDAEQMGQAIGTRVEKTFVPMRNTLFLTIAANRAVALGCNVIITGVCQEDNANYPDCTNIFIDEMTRTINCSLGNVNIGKSWIYIKTPLMFKSKAETCKLATSLKDCMLALAYSHTSYDGKYPPTDMNHANVLRAKGFEDARLPDPLVVRAWVEGLMDLPLQDNYFDMVTLKQTEAVNYFEQRFIESAGKFIPCEQQLKDPYFNHGECND